MYSLFTKNKCESGTYKYFRLDISESFFLGRCDILFLWNSLSNQKQYNIIFQV